MDVGGLMTTHVARWISNREEDSTFHHCSASISSKHYILSVNRSGGKSWYIHVYMVHVFIDLRY